jgi:hypothetical protein
MPTAPQPPPMLSDSNSRQAPIDQRQVFEMLHPVGILGMKVAPELMRG